MIGYGKLVLVIDEDERARLETALVLKQAGFTVVQACDGLEALSEMQRRHFDAVVTDFHLSNLDGLEFLAQSRVFWSDTPVIIVSKAQWDMGEMAVANEVFAWIRKSSSLGVLVSILALAVAQGVEQGVGRESTQAKELVGA